MIDDVKKAILSTVADHVTEKALDVAREQAEKRLNPFLEKRMQKCEKRIISQKHFSVQMIMYRNAHGKIVFQSTAGDTLYIADKKIGKIVVRDNDDCEIGTIKSKKMTLRMPKIGRLQADDYLIFRNGSEIGRIKYDNIWGKKKMSFTFNGWTVTGKQFESYLIEDKEEIIARVKRYIRFGEDTIFLDIMDREQAPYCVLLALALHFSKEL